MAVHEPPGATVSVRGTARALRVTGRVQGVGFRPFVYRLAHRHQVAGWVCNATGEVHIHVEGADDAIAAFTQELLSQAPPLARPYLAGNESVTLEHFSDFTIRASNTHGPARIHVPPDQFACDECLSELGDPAARRYRYPFINCTQCGPRYTIIRAMPYDRPNTTLASFALCPACRAEYENPLDRRFHAQPLACPDCGPQLLWSRPGAGQVRETERALAACLGALRNGEIVAARGIGGYHLLCDAADDQVVARLRRRKHRPDKPFAVMIPATGADGLDAARALARIGPDDTAALLDPIRPIVLVECRSDTPLARLTAPGLDEVGLMLPYSPLHHLLLTEFGRPLIATSGNLSGEPVLTEPEEAEGRLADVADAFLHHDRPIERPADDPVVRPMAHGLRPIRLGRGLAPVELELPFALERPMLAVGAFMKSTVALAWENRVVVSPHIGDLASSRSRKVFRQVCADLQKLYGVRAEHIACDAHPDYPNSRWAKASGLPVSEVFHHHAHAGAVAGEAGAVDEKLLCFTWDGTGLGDDGTLWGGEALVGRPGSWRRIASWRPFRLPGGEQAIREPWRTALGLCWEAGETWQGGERVADPLLQQAWARGFNAPATSSVGRLFDGAAAIVGDALTVSYDGQAPMQLETLARGISAPALVLPLLRDGPDPWRTDWSPLLPALVDDSRPARERAAMFHATLAQALVEQARVARLEYGVGRVALAGGVFQNRLLITMVKNLLESNEFTVIIPQVIPINDGGIAFGQIVEAAICEDAPARRH